VRIWVLPVDAVEAKDVDVTSFTLLDGDAVVQNQIASILLSKYCVPSKRSRALNKYSSRDGRDWIQISSNYLVDATENPCLSRVLMIQC
jgi:hypothetical protein